MLNKVPIIDIAARYKTVEKEINESVLSVLKSGQFILGPEVSKLEEEAAEYIGVKHAVGVASGTDALHLALRAYGIGEGDEVITTPFTFIATVEAIVYTGAKPVLVDILPDSYNIDPDQIEKKINEKTKAIIPVHMYGQAADMDSIWELAQKYGLKVIEDAAQAFGGEYRDKKLSGIGHVGCTSFFPTKNLGGAGDGGMVFTNDEKVAGQVRMLRVHGSKDKYVHQIVGYNSRLDSLQAAVVRVHLRHLDEWNDLRRQHASKYNSLLKGNEKIVLPKELDQNKHVYHLYSVRVKEREKCQRFLGEKGVSTAIHYPIPAFEQESFRYLGYKDKDLPVCSEVSEEVLSLPMFPELKDEQTEYVCKCLLEYLG